MRDVERQREKGEAQMNIIIDRSKSNGDEQPQTSNAECGMP